MKDGLFTFILLMLLFIFTISAVIGGTVVIYSFFHLPIWTAAMIYVTFLIIVTFLIVWIDTH